jgi:hypothetical protein
MAALLAGASFGVHQLRFLIGYGSHSSAELAHQGHAYLSVLAPVVVGALMVAVAEFAGGLSRARHRRIPSLTRLWILSSGALLAAYCVQELTESSLSSGHAGGLAGVFGAGGWSSIPLAIVAGLVVALLMGGAAAAERAVVHHRLRRPTAAIVLHARPPATVPSAGSVFLCTAAPRAPPLHSV